MRLSRRERLILGIASGVVFVVGVYAVSVHRAFHAVAPPGAPAESPRVALPAAHPTGQSPPFRLTVSGRGDDVQTVYLERGRYIASISASGNRTGQGRATNCIIEMEDADAGDWVLLLNDIGATCNARETFVVRRAATYYVSSQMQGSWTVSFERRN